VITKLTMTSNLSDSEDRVSKLELENFRLRNEVERLAGSITFNQKHAVEEWVAVNRRLCMSMTQPLSIFDNLSVMVNHIARS
jgi:hypothetical protein